MDGTMLDEKKKQTWMQEEKKQEQIAGLQGTREKSFDLLEQKKQGKSFFGDQRQYKLTTIPKKDVKIKPFFLGTKPWMGGEASSKHKQRKNRNEFRNKTNQTHVYSKAEERRERKETQYKTKVEQSLKQTKSPEAKEVLKKIKTYYATLSDVNRIRSKNSQFNDDKRVKKDKSAEKKEKKQKRLKEYQENVELFSKVIKDLNKPEMQKIDELKEYRDYFLEMSNGTLSEEKITAPNAVVIDATKSAFTMYQSKKVYLTKTDGTKMKYDKSNSTEILKKQEDLKTQGYDMAYDADKDQYYYTMQDRNAIEPGFTTQNRSEDVLFSREITSHDVAQGGVGDCYFLTALQSLADNAPEKIKEAMRDDGSTVTVRFYQMTKSGPQPVYIKVTKETCPKLAQGALWVQIMEKAYTVYRSMYDEQRKAQLQGQPEPYDYAMLGFGFAHTAMEHLVGFEGRKREMTVGEASDLRNIGKLYASIKQETDEDYVVRRWSSKKAIQLRKMHNSDPKLLALYNTYLQKQTENLNNSDKTKEAELQLAEEQAKKQYEDERKKSPGYADYEKITQEHAAALQKRSDEKKKPRFYSDSKKDDSTYLGQIYIYQDEMNKIAGNNMKDTAEAFANYLEQLVSFGLRDLTDKLKANNSEVANRTRRITITEVRNAVANLETEAEAQWTKYKTKIIDELKKLGVDTQDQDVLNEIEKVKTTVINRTSARIKNLVERSGNYHNEPFSDKYTKKDEDEFEKICDALENKGSVMIGTDGNLKTDDSQEGFCGEKMKDGMVLGHGYSIVDAKKEGNTMYVKIRNPWGCGIPAYDQDKDGNLRVGQDYTTKTNGEAWKEWNDLMSTADTLSYF